MLVLIACIAFCAVTLWAAVLLSHWLAHRLEVQRLDAEKARILREIRLAPPRYTMPDGRNSYGGWYYRPDVVEARRRHMEGSTMFIDAGGHLHEIDA